MYKIGDKVKYTHSQGSYEGEVIAISPHTSRVTVEFGPTVIPPQMDFPDSDPGLSRRLTASKLRSSYVDTEKYCPDCKNEWKTHLLFTGRWVGCDICNESKDKIMEEWQNDGKGTD